MINDMEVKCFDQDKNEITHFTQWDQNQTLYFSSDELKLTSAPAFHFCNVNSEYALTVSSAMDAGHNIIVKVPNKLLAEPYTLLIYIYSAEAGRDSSIKDASNKTIHLIRLPVLERKQPSEYEYIENIDKVTLSVVEQEIQNLQTQLDGKAPLSHGTHVVFSAQNPQANGTASAGTASSVPRSDHIHPKQTDIDGNSYTATKLKTARTIDGVTFDGNGNVQHHGTCSTGASTAAKITSISGFVLSSGSKITVLFSNGITCSNATLNVSNTGAKPIYYNGQPLPTNYISSNSVAELVYTGSYWRIVGDLNDLASNGKILWRGALLYGGIAEFNVPKKCFHNNETTLSLLIDGYYRTGLSVASSGKNFGLTGVVLHLGTATDFGLGYMGNESYGPYTDSDGNSIASFYRNDSVSGKVAMVSADITVQKVPDTRYAVCKFIMKNYSDNNAIVTCISAISPTELEV